MFLMAPSTKSCKEMLSLYCTLFPLKVKEFAAFDSIFSFLSSDCVTSRSRLKAANFWSNLASKSWENNCKGSAFYKDVSEEEALSWAESPTLLVSKDAWGMLAVSVSDMAIKTRVERDASNGSCITWWTLNSVLAPWDTLQARLKYSAVLCNLIYVLLWN